MALNNKAGNNVSAGTPGEDTPLLLASDSFSSGQLGESSERSNRHVTFRRTSVTLRSSQSRRPSNAALLRDRRSVRTTLGLFPGVLEEGGDGDEDKNGGHQRYLEPVDALAPLVAGGVIVATNGYTTVPHPPSTIKSLPAFAPFRRKARHRSFTLWWINEFRHWWKSR